MKLNEMKMCVELGAAAWRGCRENSLENKNKKSSSHSEFYSGNWETFDFSFSLSTAVATRFSNCLTNSSLNSAILVNVSLIRA